MLQKTVAAFAASFLIGLGAGGGASARVGVPAGALDTGRPTLVLPGPNAMVTLLVRPEKTADFEFVLDRLRHGLLNSVKPLRQRQAAGWSVYKGTEVVADYAVYVMRIEPVVEGEDYDITRLIAEVCPEEVDDLAARYRSALGGRAVASLVPLAPARTP